MVELLRTKLFIPRKRVNLVSRQRLVERLNSSLEKKLTLISAPAGFGKTTLLSEWITKCPRLVTWLFLDEGDNDPTQFWAYFIASLQSIHPDLGAGAFALLQSQQAPSIKSILTDLINDLTALSDPFASVLDDYHFIDSQPIHEALSFLIDHLPANMHMVITTREDPDLPLARLRARDHLTEIRAQDLRFTQEETDVFLRNVMGLELSRQEVAALEDRTEGWAVGLQLAGLSMQRQADRKTFITDFSGSHRHILDYLTDEVLQREAESVRSFLLQTAILDRLSGPLCDALTGRDDSDRLLTHLEAANLFVIPLDEERRWYRYHHLFSDLLLSQLTRSQPDLVPELHRRASCWYEENGDIQAAIDHALQDTDLTCAARLIEQHAIQKLYQGEVARVLRWFDRLPEEILESAPMMCIYKAWALVLMQRGLRREEVDLTLKVAEQSLDRVSAGKAMRDLVAGHAASIRAYLLQKPSLMGKTPETLIAMAREAQRLLPSEEKAIRSANALNIGYGYLALADLESAGLAFQGALEEGLSDQNFYAAIYGPINLALIACLEGKHQEALQVCEVNIKRFNRLLAGQNFPAIGALYVLKGSILLEDNRLVEAGQALAEGLNLIRWTGEWNAHRIGYTALARLHAIQSDRPSMLAALQTLEEAWPEGALYAQSLHHRLSIRHWPEDPQVQVDARNWLSQAGIEFGELLVIDGVDQFSTAHYENYLNAAHVLARLGKESTGNKQDGNAQVYLKSQQDFAFSHGFASQVVAVAIARTLLYQAERKKPEALAALTEALITASPTGLFRIFVDECEPLQSLIEEVRPRLTDKALITYVDHLLVSMSCMPSKSDTTDERDAHLSEREIEVLRLLVRGLTYQEIGEQLFLSLNTIQFHVKNIYGKLLVNKRVQAIEKAREMNLI